MTETIDKPEDIPVISAVIRKVNTPKLWAVWFAHRYPAHEHFWVGFSIMVNVVTFAVMLGAILSSSIYIQCPAGPEAVPGLVPYD